MLRRSRYIPALAVAASGLLAAACSAPAGAGSPNAAPARHARAHPDRRGHPGVHRGRLPPARLGVAARPAGQRLGARRDLALGHRGPDLAAAVAGRGEPAGPHRHRPGARLGADRLPGIRVLLRADADRHRRRGPALARDRPAAGRREPGPVLLRAARRGHRGPLPGRLRANRLPGPVAGQPRRRRALDAGAGRFGPGVRHRRRRGPADGPPSRPDP